MNQVSKAAQSDIVCRVVKGNETVLFDIDTLEEEPEITFEIDGVVMQDSLTVPLRNEKEEAFAVLQFINKKEGSFTGSDELVVHMASTAFETVLDASLLSDVRFDLGLGTIDTKVEDIALGILERAMELVSSEAGQVLVLEEEKTQMKRIVEITSSGEKVRMLDFIQDMKVRKKEIQQCSRYGSVHLDSMMLRRCYDSS